MAYFYDSAGLYGHPICYGHPAMFGHAIIVQGPTPMRCKYCGICSLDIDDIIGVGTQHCHDCPRYPSRSDDTSSSYLGSMTLYHATNESAARSILQNGFRCGSDGCVGGGIYFADSKSSARHKSRRGDSVVLRAEVSMGDAQVFRGSASNVNSSRVDRSRSVYLPDGASGEGESEYVVFSDSQISDVSRC